MTPGTAPVLSREALRSLAAEGAAEAVRTLARLTGRPASLEETLHLPSPARAALVRLGGPGPELIAVGMDLQEPLGGSIVLLVDAVHAERVASALAPGAAAGSLDAEGESALIELANIAGSAFVSTLARTLGGPLLHGVPRLARGRVGPCLDELAGGATGPAFAARMRCLDGPGMLLLLPDPLRMPALSLALEEG
jgi:chemotaxis protein CheY-P-specific phosphatase CheC